MVLLLVSFLGGSVMKVDITGGVKKKVLFVFQFTVNFRYLVKLDPNYPRINIIGTDIAQD